MLSQVIADAFHDLPPSQWLIPDPAARREILPGYFRIYVEHAMASGIVHTTAGPGRRRAVAPRRPRTAPAQPARLREPGWPRSPAGGPSRFPTFDAALDRHHPPAPPTTTWPSSPSARTGRARAPAPRCCAPTTPSSTEPDTPGLPGSRRERTRQLYRRHGYLPSGLFHLPGDHGPGMWPMVRLHPEIARQRTLASTPTTTQRTSVPQSRSTPETAQ